jgi:hypothetical protein
MTIINAFHPDYMKTHEPDFMRDLRTNQANREQSAKQSKVIDRERAAGKSPGTILHMGVRHNRDQDPCSRAP